MNIDHGKAESILSRAHGVALGDKFVPSSRFSKEIERVISGTHKTYKYILITALLAKAADPKANPLALQAGSSLPGAFDARSLCHDVIVPFERHNFFNALGGSNEPYLNKPARFPELDRRNAVRKGKDQAILNLLCDFLPMISSTVEAYSCLCDALYFAQEASGTLSIIFEKEVVKSPSYAEIYDFIEDLVEESHEGETLALVVGGLFSLLARLYPTSLKIDLHPVNQSGASSREVSDIDVYLDKALIYATEVKDKIYHAHDVKHAVIKASDASCARLLFINGPQGKLVLADESEMIDFAASKGVFLNITTIRQFTAFVLSIMIPMDTKAFFEAIRTFALSQKFKSATISYLTTLAEEHGWA